MFRFFRKEPEEQAEDLPPPQPQRLLYAVGDIHGRADLLKRMLRKIEDDRSGQPADVVFLGDYIDRGPASAEVLETLQSLKLSEATVICLMGNHERMMLDFLDSPEKAGALWISNGGQETIESVAPGRPPRDPDTHRLVALRDHLKAALGASMIDWLTALPLSFRSGTLGCVHAISDPKTPWENQKPETLLWGRPGKSMPPRSDGIWIAHGHTIFKDVEIGSGRIALDTGAYRSGVLSALRSDAEGMRVLQVVGAAR